MAQQRKPFDDREANLEAAGAFMTMMGGFENMVAQGIHLADLAPIVDPDPNVDHTSLYQLREIADMQRQRRALRVGPFVSSHEGAREGKEEPFIEPQVARHWLTTQTKRATEDKDGTLQFSSDTDSDHLGIAAMNIANGSDPRLFTEAYLEATDHDAPIADFIIQDYARDMVRRFFEDAGS